MEVPADRRGQFVRSSRVCALLAAAFAVIASCLLGGTVNAQTFTTQTWGSSIGPDSPVNQQCVTGDFNGDGLMDLACYSGSGNSWSVGLSTGSGFNQEVWSSGAVPGLPITNQCLTGDFNGDGMTDLVCHGAGTSWFIGLSTGSGFVAQSWTSNLDAGVVAGNLCVTGDFNGDGMTDLACYTGSGTGWYVGLSNGTGFNSEFWGGGVTPSTPISKNCRTGDFNGDGMTDIACVVTTSSPAAWNVALSTGTGFTTQTWSGAVDVSECAVGDFNGDGRTDFACWNGATAGTAGPWSVLLSNGAGFDRQTWNNGLGSSSIFNFQCVVGDFNGDGLTDVSCYTSGGAWGVALSTGAGFVTQGWTSSVAPNLPIYNQCLTGDFNGDGRTDISCYSGSGGNWSMGMAVPGRM